MVPSVELHSGLVFVVGVADSGVGYVGPMNPIGSRKTPPCCVNPNALR